MALPPPASGPSESTGRDPSSAPPPAPAPPLAPPSDPAQSLPDLPAPSLPPPTVARRDEEPTSELRAPSPGDPSLPAPSGDPVLLIGAESSDGPLRTSERLRRIATLSIWLYTLLAAVFVMAVYGRLGTVDAFFEDDATGADIDRWDLIVTIVAVVQVAVLVVAAVVVAIWSARSVANAEARSGRAIGTAMAAGGWFIPIGNMWLPFAKLRAAVRETGGEDRWVSRWQAGWIAAIVAVQVSNFSRRVGGTGETTQEFRDALATEAGLVALAAAVTVVAALLAHRAMRAVAATTDPTFVDGADERDAAGDVTASRSS